MTMSEHAATGEAAARAPGVRIAVATAAAPGAVGIIQLHGQGVGDLLTALTGEADWPGARLQLVDFAGIDTGLAVRLNADMAQLMPHGGPRVMQKVVEALIERGAALDDNVPARRLFPEADSDIEADALHTIARAASPAAIDLLLAQPAMWRAWLDAPPAKREAVDAILARSGALQRLIDPPGIVVVGRPNVGKSTLTNQLMGRCVSLVADLPGTTRDWVAGLVELPLPTPLSLREGLGEGQSNRQSSNAAYADESTSVPTTRVARPATRDLSSGLAVRWIDTPGLRSSDDAIEQRAIELAKQVVAAADVLIAMRDPTCDWPDAAALPRKPDIWVLNKADTLAASAGEVRGETVETTSRDAPLRISAREGWNLDALQRLVLQALGVHAVRGDELWAFSARLKVALAQQADDELREYCAKA